MHRACIRPGETLAGCCLPQHTSSTCTNGSCTKGSRGTSHHCRVGPEMGPETGPRSTLKTSQQSTCRSIGNHRQVDPPASGQTSRAPHAQASTPQWQSCAAPHNPHTGHTCCTPGIGASGAAAASSTTGAGGVTSLTRH